MNVIIARHKFSPHPIYLTFSKFSYCQNIFSSRNLSSNMPNAAFTLMGFDNQERNLMFVKTDFQVSKLIFHACNFQQAFYTLHKLYIAWLWEHKNTFIQVFLSVHGCQTCMCKRSIKLRYFQWKIAQRWGLCSQTTYASSQTPTSALPCYGFLASCLIISILH